MTRVTSATNPQFKRWKSLSASKGLRDEGQFILMGEKLVREFLHDRGGWVLREELVPDGGTPFLRSSDVRTFELSRPLFREVDTLGTNFNLLVIEAPAFAKAELEREAVGLELVCPLGDPSNLGAVVRSALAFGVSRVILTKEACHPLHPKAVKASAGAVLRIPFATMGALTDYRATGESFALDQHGEDLAKFAWPKNARLLVGEEGPGLPSSLHVKTLSIRTRHVESLNATVAASLAFFSYAQHHGSLSVD